MAVVATIKPGGTSTTTTTKPTDKYCSLKVTGKLVDNGKKVVAQVEMGDIIVWTSEKQFADGKEAISEGVMTLGYALRSILKEIESAGIPQQTT